MPKCPSCGEENPAGVGLCRSCGNQIPLEEDVSADAVADALEEQLLELLRGGKKIEAIKLYREKTGAGLKEAKDDIEALAKEHDISPSGAGCAGVLLIAAAALWILLKYACGV
jgi:ribosomal protein L7/L12